MKRVLFIVPLPPPVHGSSMISQYIKDSKLINESFKCDYVNLSTSRKMEEIGNKTFVKIWRFLSSLLRTMGLLLNVAIVDLAIKISKTQLHQDNGVGRLITGFSHGDFTPWNMLIQDGELRLIDWEFGGIRTLGYDLFTFITQVCANFNHGKSFKEAVTENTQYLDQYFYSYGIMDWTPYLVCFANSKMENESNRGYSSFAEKYKCLL